MRGPALVAALKRAMQDSHGNATRTRSARRK
jgi:hypothetical protein